MAPDQPFQIPQSTRGKPIMEVSADQFVLDSNGHAPLDWQECSNPLSELGHAGISHSRAGMAANPRKPRTEFSMSAQNQTRSPNSPIFLPTAPPTHFPSETMSVMFSGSFPLEYQNLVRTSWLAGYEYCLSSYQNR